ncbi:putative disease resistance RPP13-like protein 1 [Phragmites australis]|uniref:putative disease resistance RPP13-like protein 1 n=1 Tax=Phragmites australis TaxID=29695 RepID=UPI002D77EB28|nr:putative disease resistance RPP13-like protein 1 [Phragmites australis]XP_062202530.1 putative disease resistance RPP13-like protein 1 [Phragmites australis]
MSGVFLSLSVGRAWEKLTSLLHAFSASSSSSAIQDDLQELRKLERTMRRIRATLHDAEEQWNIREESAKLRLRELKEVACDAEDVVEEYEYEVNRRKVEALERYAGVHSTSKRKRQEENERYSMDTGLVALPCELVLRAREIADRCKEIIHYSNHLTLSENDGERRLIPDISSLQHTSSLVVEKNIVGRDQDKRKIIENLLYGEEKNVGSPVCVMAIVGMGGLGKTTLAQLVYNNLRVRQSFDKHAWISVSEHFDVNTITRNVFSSLTNERCEHTEFANLQKKLADEIKDKRVLLVLDDVWNERRDRWELFCMPMSTTRICQMIVTTRSEAVARLIQTVPFYHLKCLSSDESWSLFKQAAFPLDHGYDAPANLVEIGKSIVKKCKGLPLAIRTLGSMLRYETDEKRWEVLLENELWDLEQPRNEVLPALELSYKHMPLYLRRCFIALSLFPKDHSLDDTKVIRLWKLLDLLHCDGSDDDYEIGKLYLKQLVQRSILQVYNRELGYFYRLHDLIHDLACFLAVDEFYRLEGDTSFEIPQTVRYMSIPEGVTSIEIPIVPHSLRAIIVMAKHVKIKNPKELFLNCKKLRALHIEDRSLVEALPDFMGFLKLLRHLSFGVLRDTQSAIPISISMFQLYNLQTLDLSLYNSHKLVLSGIGHLINLHTLLPEMRLSRCGCSCNIRELRNINKIRKLRLYGLGSVSHIEDANEAQMQNKKHLRSLDFGFSVGMQHCQCMLQLEPVPVSHYQLLESLQPHRNLCELSIWDYESHKYPCWLGNDSFTKLTRIVLFRCGSQYLPTLGGLPSLKYLKVCDMVDVEQIGQEFCSHPTGHKGFPSLTNLEFVDMFKWSEWSGVEDGDFPRLHTLSIRSAPKLRFLPFVPTLRELYIEDCDGLSELPTLPSLFELSLDDCLNLSAVGALPSLAKLKIRHCSNLSAVSALPSLTTLKVRHCSNLSAVAVLPSLTTLVLSSCPDMIAVSSLPLLNTLKLDDCTNLSAFGSLPSLTTLELGTPVKDEIMYRLLNYHPSLECLKILYQTVTCITLEPQNLPSLATLRLGDCPNLEYCDGLAGLASLKELEVWGCPKLNYTSFAPNATENTYH